MNAPAMTAEEANELEIPRWVPPELRGHYREVAESRGEEEAVAWARHAKAEGSPAAESAPFVWTDDRVATLRRMVKDGHTAFQIATEIGCPSRNAVLGKIHRLGLSADRPLRPQGAERRKVALTPVPKAAPASVATVVTVQPRPAAPTPLPIQPALPPPTEGVSIFDVKAFQCRWPVSGLGISIMFCAAPVKAMPAGAPPCSWCAAHAAEAFVAVKGRVRG